MTQGESPGPDSTRGYTDRTPRGAWTWGEMLGVEETESNLLRELADASPVWSWMKGKGVKVLGPAILSALSTCDIFNSP